MLFSLSERLPRLLLLVLRMQIAAQAAGVVRGSHLLLNSVSFSPTPADVPICRRLLVGGTPRHLAYMKPAPNYAAFWGTSQSLDGTVAITYGHIFSSSATSPALPPRIDCASFANLSVSRYCCSSMPPLYSCFCTEGYTSFRGFSPAAVVSLERAVLGDRGFRSCRACIWCRP